MECCWLRDKRLAELLYEFIDDATLGMSADSMLRVNNVMENILNDGPGFAAGLEAHIQSELLSRYASLRSALLPLRNRFAIESANGFFYLWIKCAQPTDWPCHQTIMRLFTAEAKPGTEYGADDSYARMTAATYSHVFDEFVRRVKLLH